MRVECCNKKIKYFDSKKIEFIDDDDLIYITLKKYNTTVIIDTHMFYSIVNKYPLSKWTICNGYACINTQINGRIYTKKYLHRIVTNEKYRMVDHINNDRFDNRLINLRETDHSKNKMNSKPHLDRKYKGVQKSRHGNYKAVIVNKGKHIYIGSFNTQEEAALAYNKKSKLLFGEYSRINNI